MYYNARSSNSGGESGNTETNKYIIYNMIQLQGVTNRSWSSLR